MAEAPPVPVEVGDQVIKVTHPDRVMFPGAGLTKLDMVRYYAKVADHALPHLRGRPLTMQRFPQGTGKPGFFTKERPKHFPEWVGAATVPVAEETRKKRGGELVMPVVDTAEALSYVANQGCVTPHVWLSRADRPFHPDRLVFDLDPSGSDFDLVRETALELRDVFGEAGLVPFVKSTGSRGLHVEVPLDRSAEQPAVRAYAEAIAADLAARHPDTLTTAFSKAERKGRLYLDVARNGHAQTVVAAYCLRALPDAPVAAPLEWDEVTDSSLVPGRWTATNVFRRLSQRPDPWASMDEHARPLPA